MQSSAMEIAERDLIAGLEKGLSVIEAFDETRPRLSVSEVARITGLTRAAARRYLLTLTKLDYAAFDGKFFSLMPRILRLGHAYLASTGLPALVQPYLEQVTAATQESSSAAIIDDTEIVYIARSATRRIMSIGLAVGTRLPAYCTSLGRILLAHMPPDALERYFARVDLRALTPKTRTSRAEIEASLVEARATGFALVDEELELGLRSMSVPVFDKRGLVVAAMNISAQAGRATAEAMIGDMLPHLRVAQEALRRVA
jgi:IclR family pca regulon transcriptional regulator